jgi:hypothetical protein
MYIYLRTFYFTWNFNEDGTFRPKDTELFKSTTISLVKNNFLKPYLCNYNSFIILDSILITNIVQ